MSQRILGMLFDAGGKNRIQAILDLGTLIQESDLQRSVSKAAPFALPALRIDAQDGELSVFGYPLQLETKGLTCEAGLLASDASGDPLGTGEIFRASKGHYLGRLALNANVSVKGKAAGSNGALKLSAEGTAAAAIAYEHFLPVAAAATVGSALESLVRTTQLPHFARFARLTPGEALVFDGNMRLDFGAKVSAGTALDIDDVVRPFGKLELPVQAHVRFMAEAAVGWSLYERMRCAVVRGLTDEAGWVRVRLDRESKRTFTLGALFELGVTYDAAKGLETILDEAFELVPKGRSIDLVRKLATTPWGKLRDELTGEAADVLTAWVDDTGWKEWLASSNEVKQLTSAAAKFVKLWDGLDERAQEIWRHLLDRVDMSPESTFRKHLDQIADLDLDGLDLSSSLPRDLGKAWNLLEMLLGRDLEDLLLEGESATAKALETVIERAGALRELLDSAPDSIIEGIRRVGERIGIAAIANWLKANATSVEQLQTAGSAFIADLVRRLVGRALEEVNESDVAKLQATASDLVAVLDKVGALETRLRKEVGRLRGEFKGSLTLGFSSETKREALLDLELDPDNSKVCKSVEDELRAGDVARMLVALNKLDDKGGFRIRACRIWSSRVRRSATSLVMSWLPLGVAVARIEESSLEISGNNRNLRYAGGAQRTVTSGAACVARTTMVVEAKGAGLDPEGSCVHSGVTLEVAVTREDDKTSAGELKAIARLLGALGFIEPDDTTGLVPQSGSQTSLFVALRFKESAIESLFGELTAAGAAKLWRAQFEDAAATWFRDGFDQREDVKLGPLGDALATVVKDPQFEAIWTDGKWPSGSVTFTVNNHSVSTKAPALIPLRALVPSQAASFKAARALRLPPKETTPSELRSFTKLSASVLKDVSGGDWPSPFFTLWLIKTRLSALKPALWESATGVATLRWRQDAGMDWSEPRMWER